MAGSNSHITILTLNVNGQNAPTKDTDWQIGEKVKTLQCAVSRKPISHARIHKDSKNGMEADLTSKWRAKKKNQELQFSSLIKYTLNQQR